RLITTQIQGGEFYSDSFGETKSDVDTHWVVVCVVARKTIMIVLYVSRQDAGELKMQNYVTAIDGVRWLTGFSHAKSTYPPKTGCRSSRR
ncbi:MULTISPECIES: hypothetical protein, partial [unclassified Caballeronia]|uniref:hypothetical protein n=1 Tax=unclassified Caballeronia TaxID=2646786 RepID=UPI0020288F98